MAEFLFVYGTLHPDRAPEEIAEAVNKLRPLGAGTTRGELHDLGEYPAVFLESRNRSLVKGLVFALPEDAETLASLDRYEEFQPSDPENSLFIRAKRLVTFADGTRRRCWVYLYNRPLPIAS